ncbi:hypothetical protein J1614_005477 [Plenodomus biglobosus]|nr:hypothetical protein J1614_005477 [Plenodomus biglobosus]
MENCFYRQEDGSYFIDADPDVFQYVLEFMRRPSKLTLFWTRQTGFDYALYNNLEAEADHFLLHDLRNWLRKKRYLDAVKTILELRVSATIMRFHPKNYLLSKLHQSVHAVESRVERAIGKHTFTKEVKKRKRSELCPEEIRTGDEARYAEEEERAAKHADYDMNYQGKSSSKSLSD